MIDLKHKNLVTEAGHLWIGDCDTTNLAKKYGTPIYVINEVTIRQRYNELKNVIEKHYSKYRIHYAVKANSNIALLKILLGEGAHLDCVSVGEIYASLKAGFKPEQIIYTGNNFTNQDLEYASAEGVIINLEALSQIKRLRKIVKRMNRDPDIISFRVNPEFGTGHHDHCITAGPDIKFGILERDIIEAYRQAVEFGFRRFGIHMHIGSQILEVDPFRIAAEKFLKIAGNIREQLGISFEFIDFGGGFGIPYKPEDKPFDLENYGKIIFEVFNEKIEEYDLGEPVFSIEPGRFIVAESTIILSEVNTLKRTTHKNFAGIDAGFHNLVRPVMYGSHHEILIANKMDQQVNALYDVAGPLCESGDILAKDRELPNLEEGDLMAILDAGAYGFTMASNYNLRPFAAEVLVRKGRAYIIREQQPLEDLLKFQNIPEFL